MTNTNASSKLTDILLAVQASFTLAKRGIA